jgi:hypothetical protein
MQSLVKQIEPLSEKAEEFVQEHGDTFVIEFIGGSFMMIRSTKTQKHMRISAHGGNVFIDGEMINWQN